MCGNQLTIVMYHYVREIKNSPFPGIKGREVHEFLNQLDYFQKNYNIIRMEDLLHAIENEEKLPARALLLTFDDGYVDHFRYVFPLLVERGVQGSFFVPAKVVEEHEILEPNKVHFLLAAVDNIDLLIYEMKKEMNKCRKNHPLESFDRYFEKYAHANRFDDEKTIFFKRMLQVGLPDEVRRHVSNALFEKYLQVDQKTFSETLYLNKKQLREMVQEGMHVGNHGYDHYWWNKISEEDVENEIVKSLKFLESVNVDTIQWSAAYPYGSYDEKSKKILAKHGCKVAFTTEVRVADLVRNDPLVLPRLDTNDFPCDGSENAL